MADLPTCWYCPECKARTLGQNLVHITDGKPCRAKSIEIPAIPPGTPLPVILDALGHTYRRGGMKDFGDGTFEVDEIESSNRVPVLVVDNPATDEAGCHEPPAAGLR